jgi:arsenite methyltransferase
MPPHPNLKSKRIFLNLPIDNHLSKGETMSEHTTPIHEKVREYYAGKASPESDCLGSSCCSSSTFYSPELIDKLPEDISSFSLGCGDPVTLAGLQAGETVVDLGSGGGLDCFLAARLVGETGRVTGVDMTPEMLERARAAAVKLGINNVDFRYGFLENLPIEDTSTDVVISNCVINLAPDKPKVLREIFRVLKPGGRVAVSDIVLNGELPVEVQNNQEAWSACISGAIQPSEYADQLRDAGFVDVEVKALSIFEEAAPLVAEGMPYSALITAKKPV